MTAAAPTVGILLPLYNGSAYVAEAIASVERQTSPDWQLLAIDDASSDDSYGRIEHLTDKRMASVRNSRNLGLYGTLVEGIARLATDWVVVLMQDDRLRSDYVQAMRSLVAAHPTCDGFWSAHQVIDASGAVIATGRDTGRQDVLRPGVAVWTGALERGCFWTISGSMTRRQLFDAEPFRTDLPHCGDFDWLLRVVRTTSLVYYERPLTELRRHDDQASAHHMREGRHLSEICRVIDHHLRTHANDVDSWTVFRIGGYRASQAVRNLLGNLGRGRLRAAVSLAATAWRFLRLPIAFSVRRLRA